MARLSPNSLNIALISIRLARSAPLLTLGEVANELREGQIQPLHFFTQLPNDIKAAIDSFCQADSGKKFTALSHEAQRVSLVEAFTPITYPPVGQDLSELITNAPKLTFRGFEEFEIKPKLIAPETDWLKPNEQTGLPWLNNERLFRSLEEGLTRAPQPTESDGPRGARLAATNTMQASSRSYAPAYSSPSYGRSSQKSVSKIGAGIVFGIFGLLLGLFLAGLIWTASWTLHWAFALEIGRAVTTSRGWWIGWPVGVALVGIVIGIWRDE
jgi:hypothetical protein